MMFFLRFITAAAPTTISYFLALKSMTQIGNVSQINAVKKQMDQLKERNLVKEWEVPYEHLLTRRSAALFFFTPTDESSLGLIWEALAAYAKPHYVLNTEKKLSALDWRVEFIEQV